MGLRFDEQDTICLSEVFKYSAFDQTNPWEKELAPAKKLICERFAHSVGDLTNIKVSKADIEGCLKTVFGG
jgi:hypothetical protein